jgi:hypothetical protein
MTFCSPGSRTLGLLASLLLVPLGPGCGGDEFAGASPQTGSSGQAGASGTAAAGNNQGGSNEGGASPGVGGSSGASPQGEGGASGAGSAGNGGAEQGASGGAAGSEASGAGGVAQGGSAGTGAAGNSASGASGAGGTGGTGGAGGAGGTAVAGGAGGTGGAAQGGSGGTAAGMGGGGATQGCSVGLQMCPDGSCEDQSSPKTCGPQCSPCPVPPGAVPVCSNGTCEFTCAEGLARYGDSCLDFGGVFQKHAGCAVSNSYGGGCGCPDGFAPSVFEGISTPTGSSTIGVCHAAGLGHRDYGGTYLVESPAQSSNPCIKGNELRNDTACGCPLDGSWEQIQLPVQTTSTKNAALVFCSREGSPTGRSFYGSYEKYDGGIVSAATGKVCAVPATLTSNCSCPAGSTVAELAAQTTGQLKSTGVIVDGPVTLGICGLQ